MGAKPDPENFPTTKIHLLRYSIFKTGQNQIDLNKMTDQICHARCPHRKNLDNEFLCHSVIVIHALASLLSLQLLQSHSQEFNHFFYNSRK